MTTTTATCIPAPRRATKPARAIATAFALAAVAASLQAGTPGVDEPPAAGPAAVVTPPPVVVRQLDNGLTVIVARRPKAPLVSVSVLVKAGPERDGAGHAGLADLTATLLTRGAIRNGKPQGATEISRAAETLGGDLASSSGFGRSEVGLTVSTPRLPEALALLADLVRRPTFTAAEFQRAVAEQQDALRLRMSNPAEVAVQGARRAFWGASPYGASATPASVARLTRIDVQQFHSLQYRPEATAVVFSGDIDEPTALAQARQRFGDWSAPKAAAPAPADAAPLPQAAALVAIDLPGTGQSGVVVAAPFVPLGAPERIVAQVANGVLGGGYSARLNQEVRIKRGLAYGASSRGESTPAGGVLLARSQTKNASAGEVVGLIRDELARLGATPPPADELAARQATLVGSFGRQLDTTATLGQLVGAQWLRGLPMDDLSHYTERVLAVTPEQVRDYAARTWTPASLRVVVAGDMATAGAGLKAVAKDAVFLKIEAVDFERPTLMK